MGLELVSYKALMLTHSYSYLYEVQSITWQCFQGFTWFYVKFNQVNKSQVQAWIAMDNTDHEINEKI